MRLIEEIFGVEKPIIGMIHLKPLLGTPGFTNLREVLDSALEDAGNLVEGGVDGLLIENFFDSPFYPDKVPPHVISSMTMIAWEIKSYWYILTPEGKMIPVDEYDFRGRRRLELLTRYEIAKSRAVLEQPPHVALMKRLKIADYEPASDPGNMRWLAKGRLIKSLLEQFVTQKVIEYGGIEVETPIMYDMSHPSLEKYLHRFSARGCGESR